MAVAFLILAGFPVRAATVDTRSFSVSATVVGGCTASTAGVSRGNRCAGSSFSTRTHRVEDGAGSREVAEVQY